MNVEHATVIFNQAERELNFKFQQLLEANNPQHFPLVRAYALEIIGIKAEAQKQYEVCTSLTALKAALKTDGHGEAVDKYLVDIDKKDNVSKLKPQSLSSLSALHGWSEINRDKRPLIPSTPSPFAHLNHLTPPPLVMSLSPGDDSFLRTRYGILPVPKF